MNTPYDTLAESAYYSTYLTEAEVFDSSEESERQRKRAALGKKVWDKLTDIQKRRYVLHHVHGRTTRDIADMEGVSHVAIVYSLELAEKKIRKYLAGKS